MGSGFATSSSAGARGSALALGFATRPGVFRVNAKQPKGGDSTTQFARAMAELNIDVLCANCPQAKGRVERAHQTLHFA